MGQSILADLSSDAAARLNSRRNELRSWAHVDESVVVPALERYSSGILYQAAGRHLAAAAKQGSHILILSGGYGLVRASEPIGNYDAVFRLTDWWPLVGDCLIEYCVKHSIESVIGLTAMTGDYSKVIRLTDWKRGGVRRSLLLTPDLRGRGGAMRKAPQTIGEAVVALLSHGLPADWRSSAGIPMERTSTLQATR